jgi:prepilin-type N-terminal cleavage/methylation domain-containing protein
MTSRTGNNRGFTLLEVMLASVVLALGTVMIYQAYFSLLNSHAYMSEYLRLSPWMDEKLWEAQDVLAHGGGQAGIETHGGFLQGGRKFAWDLNISPISQREGLFDIELVVAKVAEKGNRRFSRNAYVIQAEK